MAMKRKNRCVPLVLNELITGQSYIEMVVCSDGQMYTETFTVLGRPYRYNNRNHGSLYGKWMVDSYVRHRYDGFIRENFASSLGIDVEERHNSHRVFRYTMRNMEILQSLVKRQALQEYLALIAETQVEKVLDRIAWNQTHPIDDIGDDYDDESDAGLEGRSVHAEDL